MIISLIVAMDERRGIGSNGVLPWHLSADLQRFKALTMGHRLILGRKTYESIGRPLQGRTMIVLTRKLDGIRAGSLGEPAQVLIAHSLEQALDLARQGGETEVFVGGGGQVFVQALPLAERIYLTQVHAVFECDTFFPRLTMEKWVEHEHLYHPPDENNLYPFTYRLLEKSPIV